VAVSVVSMTSDAMPRIAVGFMYLRLLSFDQVYPSRRDPQTPKYSLMIKRGYALICHARRWLVQVVWGFPLARCLQAVFGGRAE